MTTLERFWSKVSVTDGCWIWNGCKTPKGYGDFHGDGFRFRAHRFSYMIHFGDIPGGMCVCHRCDVRDCVNPSHLFLGTVAENNSDMHKKNRHVIPTGSRHGRSKLNESEVLEILRLHANGETRKSLSQKFKISYVNVINILNGKRWSHLQVHSLAGVKVGG